MIQDEHKIVTVTRLWKFNDPDGQIYLRGKQGISVDQLLLSYKKYLLEYKEVIGNVFLTTGIAFIWNCVTSGSCSPAFGSNAQLCVGDGTTAESPSQTGLTGTNQYCQTIDSGYPTISQNQVTFRATFGSSVANFSWNEWGVSNGSTFLNRKQQSLGTKASGSTWILQVTLSIS